MLQTTMYMLPRILIALILQGCAVSAAGPVFFHYPSASDEVEVVGVVNGLWEYEIAENKKRLLRDEDRFSKAEIDQLATRYQVRVGIRRGIPFGGMFSEIAFLPAGWRYSTREVIDDGRTINVGDVVLIRGRLGHIVDEVLIIRRKCNAPPAPGESWYLNIGCKRVEEFNREGYGGEHYLFAPF